MIHSCGLWNIEQVFTAAVDALRISYKKMNPFSLPLSLTNMGSAMLAMDLVSLNLDNIHCNMLRIYHTCKNLD